jgi:hypothetical protein
LYYREIDDGTQFLTIFYWFHRQLVARLKTKKEFFGSERMQHYDNRLPVLQAIQKLFGIDPFSSEARDIWDTLKVAGPYE